LTKNNTKMDELGDALSRFRTKYQIVSSLANDAESSSRVFQAKHLETGEEFAVKIIEKGQLKDPEKARREIEIMSKCNHQHIVRLFEAFQDNERAIIVMELMRGGTLFDRLSALQRRLTEDEVRELIRQIALALDYLHSNGIVHRDLKPENILFKTSAHDSILKIGDFGFAQFAQENDLLATPCGTPGYAAPEICISEGNRYTRSVDLWSLGVIFYFLLCGFLPFDAEDDDSLIELVKEGIYTFPSPVWDSISESAKDLVTRLLEKDPAKRITAKQLLQHPWLKSPGREKNLSKSFGELRISTTETRGSFLPNSTSFSLSRSKLYHSLNKSIEVSNNSVIIF
jgi:calcium/calmodulin-dependent protein kinase I